MTNFTLLAQQTRAAFTWQQGSLLCLLSEGGFALRADRGCRPRPVEYRGSARRPAGRRAALPRHRICQRRHLKIDLTLDHLAGKEMEVGRYYLLQRDYIGAINRFRAVVEQYPRTPQITEALERLTEAYYALGLDSEAQTAAAVLGANYPGSPWYQDAYNLLKGNN